MTMKSAQGNKKLHMKKNPSIPLYASLYNKGQHFDIQ